MDVPATGDEGNEMATVYSFGNCLIISESRCITGLKLVAVGLSWLQVWLDRLGSLSWQGRKE